MKTLLVALHGILTNQTDASWPDKLDAWMFERNQDIKVLKKEYPAGPFPRWNCWVKDPHLAQSLANEIELFLSPPLRPNKDHFGRSPESGSGLRPNNHQFGRSPDSESGNPQRPGVWFVAHSNGAVIALLTAKILINRGYRIQGLILTGAAIEADLMKNGIQDWLAEGTLPAKQHDPPELPGHAGENRSGGI